MNWIPISERLPNPPLCHGYAIERYLVTVDKPNKYGDVVYFSTFFKDRFSDLNGSSIPKDVNIIAWMEIPEPYQK